MGLVSRPIPYRDGQLSLTGQLWIDESRSDRRPGLLLVHGAGGLDAHIADQAARYVDLGFAVFAPDMFGPGVAGDRAKALGAIAALRADPDTLVARARAGLDQLIAVPETDGRYAALGFCFGGQTVLTMARAGLPLAGVVSMHGALATARPATPDSMTVPVLVCHGADDPHVPMPDVVAFVAEMQAGGADWQLNVYGGAVHGFTHRVVPSVAPGIAYHEPTDRRSFAAARLFLDEVLNRVAVG
jgi:dienelactone hydrolase